MTAAAATRARRGEAPQQAQAHRDLGADRPCLDPRIATVPTLWINRQVLDNDNWRKTSADLIADPAVQNTLSTYLVDQLYEKVDVPGAFEEQLPSNLKGLAAPLAGALRHRPRAPSIASFNRRDCSRSGSIRHGRAPEARERAREQDGNGIDTGNGNGHARPAPAPGRARNDFGLPPDAIAKLPPTAGTVTVMSSDQLGFAQTGVQVIRILSTWLLVLMLVLYASGDLSGSQSAPRDVTQRRLRVHPRRLARARRASVVGNYIVGKLTTTFTRSTGHHVWIISTSILGDIEAM